MSVIGVVGLGMIGGSIARALRPLGYTVLGDDVAPARVAEAKELGIIDAPLRGLQSTELQPDQLQSNELQPDQLQSNELESNKLQPDVIFVSAPVGEIANLVSSLLDEFPNAVISDTGSAKSEIVSQCSHPRFVGGHPMAGSELSGLQGSDALRFQGANWVLTPNSETEDQNYLAVRKVVEAMGANVVTVDAVVHDELVAATSHLPHLTAASLMLAVQQADADDARTLRLSATGFKDMTRIAAGDAQLWADICLSNRQMLMASIDGLTAKLNQFRGLLENRDSRELEQLLESASNARKLLPTRQGRPSDVVQLGLVVADRPGSLHAVFACLGDNGINVEDLSIAHASDGTQGTMLVTVAEKDAEPATQALQSAGIESWLIKD